MKIISKFKIFLSINRDYFHFVWIQKKRHFYYKQLFKCFKPFFLLNGS